MAVLALLAALLQHTPYALLPETKTNALWGILVGVIAMAGVGDRLLRAPAQPGPPD